MARKNLQKYVQYLSEDLRAASEPMQAPAHGLFDNDPEETDYYPYKLSSLLDLSAEMFPPSNMLTNAQMARLFKDFQRLLHARNISWYLPPKVSLKNRYEAIRFALSNSTINYHYEFGGSLDLCLPQNGHQCPYFDTDHECRCSQLKQEFWDSYYDFESEQGFFEETFSDFYEDFDEEEEQEEEADYGWRSDGLNEVEDDSENTIEDGSEPLSLEEWFLRYFLDTYSDNLGNDADDDDPRINWWRNDDDELPF